MSSKIHLTFLSVFFALIPLILPAVCNEEMVFIISTEFQIGKIKHMVERAPEGVYVSVGGERSFRGICMTPHLTHAYLLDVSPKITRFNQLNIELLKAPNRKDYLHLRWEASYKDWKKFNPVLTKEDFEWWQKNVRDFGNMNYYTLPESLNRYQSYPEATRFIKMREKLAFIYQTLRQKETPDFPEKQFLESVTLKQVKALCKRLNLPMTITQKEWDWWTTHGKNKNLNDVKAWWDNPEEAVNLGQIVDYKTGNYLFDDALYQRLHHLSLNGQFTTMKIDLSDEAQLETFLSSLKKEKALISVLDLDNLYDEHYMGQGKYRKILDKFLPFGKEESLLIVMNNYKDYAGGQFQIYIGFTFENIRHWPTYFFLQSFFNTLPKPLFDLINGRVYEKEETPPYHYLLGG